MRNLLKNRGLNAVLGVNFGLPMLLPKDNIGNRESATNNGATTTYDANELNQYEEVVEAVTNVPIYDLDGNMTSFKDWHFTWNGENRMIQASNTTAGTVVDCKYDYMGRRFSKTVDGAEKTFIYDGWNMIQESSATETNHYVWGLDLSGSMQGAGGIGGLLSVTEDDGSVYFACADGNGNITGYIDDSGNVQAKYSYNPFGGVIESSGAKKDDFKYRFSSKYFDAETELSYYGLRYYDAELGRWINRDPIGEDGGYNLYGFVGNNVIGMWDFLGMNGNPVCFNGECYYDPDYGHGNVPDEIDWGPSEYSISATVAHRPGVTARTIVANAVTATLTANSYDGCTFAGEPEGNIVVNSRGFMGIGFTANSSERLVTFSRPDDSCGTNDCELECVGYTVSVTWTARMLGSIPLQISMDADIYLQVCADGTTGSVVTYSVWGWYASIWRTETD